MASALLTRVRNLERECAVPAERCPACAGAVLVVLDHDAPDDERAAALRCRLCGAELGERAKLVEVPENCI